MSGEFNLTRRDWLRLGGGAALAAALPMGACRQSSNGGTSVPPPSTIHLTDDQLLDDIQRTSFDFFWTEAGAQTGQVKDRALANGGDTRTISSIAATGFALAALCIADRRAYRSSSEILERVRTTLRFVANQLPNVHGFYYHFVDMNTGARQWNCELSSIDTALLLCGVLTAKQYFADSEIQSLATMIYERVEWPWMLNGGAALSMGWKPESGFLDARWDRYSELMIMYLLGIGSPTNPLPIDSWQAFSRPKVSFFGFDYISGPDPLFTHQYSQAFFNFRHQHDAYTNYFDNSMKATQAHKAFCLSIAQRFPDYTDSLWGITSSDSAKGYTAWGGPPELGELDGSVVPCAAGGSLPFLPADCLKVLHTIRENYTAQAWKRYGLVDAFNPLTNWTDPDVIGIDVGITMVMAENYRTGLVWDTLMKNPEAALAMQKVGFQPD